ncbi:uncharacterized protein PG986_005319 [Apiospora aurea]|uniref:Ras-like GTP-binding protein n=1 Tax=Apiospora aurea TaxID=335848 RepID=A0ABR1QI02_9PEZI
MSSLEAKIVVLGSQGVGKTSLVMRFCKGNFNPSQVTSTVGASFMAKRVIDSDTDTVVRLQIWDTAGQERFRSISRLYYRGANACILCYSITDAQSFAEMGVWLTELRRNLPPDIVLHVVGTKADIVAKEPARREVPFERCIAYVAENLAPGQGNTPPPTATPHRHDGIPRPWRKPAQHGRREQCWPRRTAQPEYAESGEGVEEVFRVVTRKLVEQNRKMQQALLAATMTPGTPYEGGMGNDYFDGMNGRGSFRVGRDRRSWLFSPGFSPAVTMENQGQNQAEQNGQVEITKPRSKCC